MDSTQKSTLKFLNLYPQESTQLKTIDPVILETMPFNWLEQLDETKRLIIYGVGLGEAYSTLKHWLRKDRQRHLIFLEDNLGIIKQLFQTETGLHIMDDDQVELLYFRPNESGSALNRLMWQSFEKKIKILKDPRKDQKAFEPLTKIIDYDFDRMGFLGREFKLFGLGYYMSYFQNLEILPQSFDGSALINCAKNVPAIIVGAGPSLNKNGYLLKDLSNKALIMAGGSSLLSLKALEVKPHLGGGIDPNLSQIDRLSRVGHFDFPFLFSGRLHANALKCVDGPKVYIPTTGGFNTETWLNEKLGILDPSIQEGDSVVNFLTQVALKMGCNPIIFVGLDLAYTDNQLYSIGVFEDLTRVSDDQVITNDINNHPVTSRWAWIKESQGMSEIVQKNPQTIFINATEGGIGIKKVVNQPLNQINLIQKFDFKKILELKPLQVKKSEIQKNLETLFESLKRLDIQLEELKSAYQKMDLLDVKTEDLLEPKEWLKKFTEEEGFIGFLKPFYEYATLLVANSHTVYLIARDGMNSKLGKQFTSLSLQKIDYLKKVIENQRCQRGAG